MIVPTRGSTVDPINSTRRAAGPPLTFLVAGLTGFALSLLLAGPELVGGDRTELLSMRGDGAIGLAGFRYFVADDWHWPLMTTTRMAAPDGIAVIFTDSIPLLALTAKVLRPLGVGAERWWGGWFSAVFVAQAMATAFTVRRWKVNSVIVQWLAGALMCLFPALLLRVFHPALMFQAPLIFSLGLVPWFRDRDAGRSLGLVAVATPLLALMVHPYHAAVVLLVVAAGIGDAVRLGVRTARFALGWLAATATAMAAVLVGFGYLAGAGQGVGAEGYGQYALVPYSFVWPQRSLIWPGDDDILLASGTYEGYVFMGFGCLILVAIGAALLLPNRRSFIHRNAVLTTGLSLLGAYAITHRVHLDARDLDDPLDFGAFALRYLGDTTQVVVGVAAWSGMVAAAGLIVVRHRHGARSGFWTLPSVAALTLIEAVALVTLISPGSVMLLAGTFRASGRLAWTLGYAAIVGSIVAVHRRFGTGPTALLLVAALSIQFYDQRPMRRFTHDLYWQNQGREARLDATATAIGAHDLVHLNPDYTCVPVGPELDEYVDVVVAASLANVPIDSTYAARQSAGSCDTEVATDDVSALYVWASRPPTGFTDDDCFRLSTAVTACSHRVDTVDPEALAFLAPEDETDG